MTLARLPREQAALLKLAVWDGLELPLRDAIALERRLAEPSLWDAWLDLVRGRGSPTLLEIATDRSRFGDLFEVAEALLRFIHGPSPSQRVATIDLGLRPEGGQGRLARDLHGYQTYFERWAQTWERQALARDDV